MALWTSVDSQAGAPLFDTIIAQGVQANGNVAYGNVAIGGFVANATFGVFGVDTTEQDVAANPKGGHSGWNLVTSGTGGVVSITANTGAVSGNGNVYITFTGGTFGSGTGNVTANAQIFTNSVSKVITSIVVNTAGVYGLTPTLAATNCNAVFTTTMNGRADRVQVETLVAMGSMTSDGSDDAVFADT
jgi:hypothetical protein